MPASIQQLAKHSFPLCPTSVSGGAKSGGKPAFLTSRLFDLLDSFQVESLSSRDHKTAVINSGSGRRAGHRSFVLLPALVLLLFAPIVSVGQTLQLQFADRVRLAEAFRIGDRLGDRIWADWSNAPFAVLLVTPDNEFLIRHPKPSADFVLTGYDALLTSNVYHRKRTQRTNFLATFPIAGVPTIVVGQAENTNKKTSTPWVVTVLHEHFHQLQYSQPGYYDAVNALELSRGDQSGMWMLDYPFPYDWMEMHEHFSHLGWLLANAWHAKTKSDLSTRLAAYLKQRHELELTLSPDDYRYFSFQLWQEGIARYTEYRVAQLAAGAYRPTKAFRSLKDYEPFADVADRISGDIHLELTTARLADSKRVMFYAIGAGEGLLLDRANPRWRQRYFAEKFYLDKYFPPAERRSTLTPSLRSRR